MTTIKTIYINIAAKNATIACLSDWNLNILTHATNILVARKSINIQLSFEIHQPTLKPILIIKLIISIILTVTFIFFISNIGFFIVFHWTT